MKCNRCGCTETYTRDRWYVSSDRVNRKHVGVYCFNCRLWIKWEKQHTKKTGIENLQENHIREIMVSD